MEEDYKNMEMLQAIIAKGNKSPDEIDDAQEKIAEFSKQREAKKSKLAAYFKGTISKADIDRITYLKDLDKEIKSSDRKIAGIDKQNTNYETAIRNIESKTQTQTQTQATSGVPATNQNGGNLLKDLKTGIIKMILLKQQIQRKKNLMILTLLKYLIKMHLKIQ